jgi:hypothetical protein
MQPAQAERERDEQCATWRKTGLPVRSSVGDALTTTILILASMVLAAQVE